MRDARNDFKAWAIDRAIQIDLDASAGENARKLSVLNPLVAGKRIAFLGEPDHFIHEKYFYRELMLRYLATRGFTCVGEELSRTDGMRIAQFLAAGDEAAFGRVASYGYRGGLRDDRDDTPTGVLKDAYTDKYPVGEFRAEQIRFARAMRGIASPVEGAGLRYFGFDVDALPGCAYEDLVAMLAAARADSVVDEIICGLARVPGESLDAEIKRLDSVRARLSSAKDQLATVLGAEVFAEAAYAVEWLRDSFIYLRSIIAAGWNDLNPAMAHRELMMHREVMRQLDSARLNEKLALLSHDVHLCRNMNLIEGMTVAAGPGGKTAPPLGDFLSKRFGGEVFSIWMLVGEGRDLQTMAPLSNEIKLVPGSFNETLAEIGDCFLLPFDRSDSRARLLDTSMQIVMDGNASIRTAPAAQADAIFFVRRVTPIRA